MKKKIITNSENNITLYEGELESGGTVLRRDVVYDTPEFIEFMHDVGKGVVPDVDSGFSAARGSGLVGGRFEFSLNPSSGRKTVKLGGTIAGIGFGATLVLDEHDNLISHDVFGGGQLIFGAKGHLFGVVLGASGIVQVGIFFDEDSVDIGVDTEISVGVLLGSVDISESYRFEVYEFESIGDDKTPVHVGSKFAVMDKVLSAERWGYRDQNGKLRSIASELGELGYDFSRIPELNSVREIISGGDTETRIRATHEALDDIAAQLSEPGRRMFDEISSETTFPADGFAGETDDHNQVVPPIPVHRPNSESEPLTDDRQDFDTSLYGFDSLAFPVDFQKGLSAFELRPENGLINSLATNDIVEVLPGVGAVIDRRSKMNSPQLNNRTNNEQLSEAQPVPRPRPKLNPITEGYMKDMPDDGRLILAAEMVGYGGRKEVDKAEASRKARFDVQRKMAQDLEDIKAGKVSTVWTEYGHPKAVRDLLGEEAYQTFVDDRLEAGIIAHATAGLHLLQDADLFGIADGTTELEAPHEKLAELMTPKVLAAAAERARDILDMRRTKPSEAVLLSSDLSKRKDRFDAAFNANEAVDAEEMDAFLFYHEAAQREIGIAEPALEIIPPNWARQVAARFEAAKAGNGTPTDQRAREAELKQHYTELQNSFGSRTDDVIAYSLARTASTRGRPTGRVFPNN